MFWFEEIHLPERWQEGDRWRLYWMASRLSFLAFLVGGFHLTVLASISNFDFLAPLSTESRYLATSIWASFLLTFALIAVYRDIGETQQEQATETGRQADLQSDMKELERKQIQIQETQLDLQGNIVDLQKQQRKAIEANHKPAIQIAGWEILEDASGDPLIELDLKNRGNGLAKSITVKIEIGIIVEHNDMAHYRPVGDAIGAAGTPEGIHPFYSPVSSQRGHYHNESGVILEPGEEEVVSTLLEFKEERFDRQKERIVTVGTIPVSRILQQINDSQKLNVSIELSYEDVLEEEYTETIYSKSNRLEEGTSLRQLIQD